MATINEAELAAAYGLSPAEFEQVIDTVLGEARGEGFIGMAGVAKAMANRADVRGQSLYDVVTAPSQFDGAAFQSGPQNAEEREIALEALAAVAMGEDPAQVGTSDHFATPETKTSWTEAFKDTAKTVGGHTFYSSPEALELAQFTDVTAAPQAKPDMAMQTAQAIDSFGMPGVGIPNVSAMNNAPSVNAFAPTIDTVAVDPFEAVINDQQAQQGGLRDRASSVAANAAITQPEGLLGYAFSDRTVRDQEIQPELAGIIGRATQAMGPEYAFSVTSGGQPAIGTSRDRVGSTRHDMGFAADGRLTVDGRGITYSQDPDLYAELAKQAGVQGAQGFGHYGWGVHIDNARPGAWGPDRTSATLSPAVRDAFNEGKAVRDAGLYSPTGPQAKPDGFISAAGLPGTSLAPSRDLSNYASYVSNAATLGRGSAPGRSYVDVDLNDFAVTNPASDYSVPSIAVDFGNGVFGIDRSGPTAAMPADVSVTTITPDRGLAPLDAPQSISSRPSLDWAADLQTSTPSIGTSSTAATAPTSNVATPQGNQQQGGGFFGQIGDALGGFFGNPAVQGTLGGMAVGGIPGAVIGGTIGAVAGRGKDKDNDKDKDKDGKGRGFGRSVIGGALRGGGIGSRLGAGGALAGAVIGGGISAARNGGIGIPGLGNIGAGLGTISDLGSNPSVGHAALGYAMDQARANTNYTGMDFSRDFASKGGQISNGRPEPGKITAAEFNAGQRDVGKAKSVGESFSEDASEAFGGCFLTTAAVDVLGESDNGDTLQTLRWFRDNIMRARPDWSADVDEYYRIAPAIVDRLNGDEATYRDLMDRHIRPAVDAIKAGKYEKAYRVYRSMVDDLQHA